MFNRFQSFAVVRRNNLSVLLPAVMLLLLGITPANSQTPSENELLSHAEQLDVKSGILHHQGETKEVIWEETIQIEDATWMRLKFKQLVLAGPPFGGESSTLRITSIQDGKFQLLNAKTALEWKNTSAYFNGNAVKIELMAAPNGRANLVIVEEATVGETSRPNVTATICDDNDDRILSNDPRVGRTAPGGCTGWLFNNRNNCMLTAGHCAPSTEVMLFNVPLSNSNGDRQFPGPEDQYAVDFASVQFANGGIGNDWCYFGCFPNSTTGLTAFEAQGDSFQLAAPPSTATAMIRITGFGSTSFPVDPTFNGAQKTQLGPRDSQDVNRVRYRTDTTGGNSGSPIINETTGEAIGIHTHGGCGSNGSGANNGTASTQAGFAAALASPLGICLTTIEVNFPNELPQFVSPDGGGLIVAEMTLDGVNLDPSSATFHFDSGSGFVESPMVSLGNNLFEATIPSSACGEIVRFYFSIDSIEGDGFTNPASAPAQSYTAVSSATEGIIAIDDNFENDLGWTISGDASTGQWERGFPVGAGDRGDPASDADGSGSCFVTENEDGDSDVDSGTTQLTSPLFNGNAGQAEESVLVAYSRWFDNGGEGDQFLIEISNDAGSTWTTVESLTNAVGDTNGGWIRRELAVADFIQPTNEMRMRFTVSDLADASIVEAGVDAFSVRILSCDTTEVLLGDVDRDGVITLLDVGPFVDRLNSGEYQLEADVNEDGVVNLFDVGPFVDLLSN